MPQVSVAEIKSHLSEFISRSAHGRERFIITRRNKPVAALVSLEDAAILAQHEERQGLAAVAGSWPEFEELSEVLEDIVSLRKTGGVGRNVSF